MTFWGIINIETSEALLKKAATMLIALTFMQWPSLIHGFQYFSIGLHVINGRKAQMK